jgi:divalent metal cation (Fe/Co/Zn/Cd) transporter
LAPSCSQAGRRLDPLIALAANMSMTGVRQVRRSTAGLMDHALGLDEQRQIAAALAPSEDGGVGFHAVRTRQGGRRAFASLHILVLGKHGRCSGDTAQRRRYTRRFGSGPSVTVFTHLEPVEDARTFDGLDLDASDVVLDPGGPQPGA